MSKEKCKDCRYYQPTNDIGHCRYWYDKVKWNHTCTEFWKPDSNNEPLGEVPKGKEKQLEESKGLTSEELVKVLENVFQGFIIHAPDMKDYRSVPKIRQVLHQIKSILENHKKAIIK